MHVDPAVSSDGLLREFSELGLLSWGDVHTAVQVCFLYDEPDQRVQLALALAVRALTAGSICLDLADVTRTAMDVEEQAVTVPAEAWPEPSAWRAALEASPAVSVGADAPTGRPLRLVGDRLYLERYWQEETAVATELRARRTASPPEVDTAALGVGLDRVFGPRDDRWQRQAAAVAVLSRVAVIAGGPGTGKTSTIARIIAALHLAHPGQQLRLALAAPTGKAAARMDEAIAEWLRRLPADAGPAEDLRATTLHRLLGWRPESRNRFVHDRSRPLPHDVVIVDEASMVSVTMMSRLLAALRPQARLVLVGDPHQLAPVEAGAVLADIAEADQPPAPELSAALAALQLPESGPVVRLRTNFRFTGAIDRLAGAVLAGDEESALAIATAGAAEVQLADSYTETDLVDQVVSAGLDVLGAARSGAAVAALAAMDTHRLLCAHRSGPHGVSWWSRQVEAWLAVADDGLRLAGEWYPGRPLLVTSNSPELGLYNGDTGVVVGEPDGRLRAFFSRGGGIWSVSPYLLEAVQTVHAMTVHKAQGSQFRRVTLVLPPPDSPLLTRELLYTAVTRASERVTLIGSADSLRAAVRQRARRASGLRERL